MEGAIGSFAVKIFSMTMIPDRVSDVRSAGNWSPGRVLVISATYNEQANVSALVKGVLGVDP